MHRAGVGSRRLRREDGRSVHSNGAVNSAGVRRGRVRRREGRRGGRRRDGRRRVPRGRYPGDGVRGGVDRRRGHRERGDPRVLSPGAAGPNRAARDDSVVGRHVRERDDGTHGCRRGCRHSCAERRSEQRDGCVRADADDAGGWFNRLAVARSARSLYEFVARRARGAAAARAFTQSHVRAPAGAGTGKHSCEGGGCRGGCRHSCGRVGIRHG